MRVTSRTGTTITDAGTEATATEDATEERRRPSHHLEALYEDQLSGVEMRLDGVEPDLEALAAAQPDLILTDNFGGEPIPTGAVSLDQLTQIAPTVVGAFDSSADWKEFFRFYADVMGRGEEASEVMNRYRQRVTEVQEALGTGRSEMSELQEHLAGGDGEE